MKIKNYPSSPDDFNNIDGRNLLHAEINNILNNTGINKEKLLDNLGFYNKNITNNMKASIYNRIAQTISDMEVITEYSLYEILCIPTSLT